MILSAARLICAPLSLFVGELTPLWRALSPAGMWAPFYTLLRGAIVSPRIGYLFGPLLDPVYHRGTYFSSFGIPYKPPAQRGVPSP